MAHDEILEARVRAAFPLDVEIVGKKMFGGVGFLLKGNMACGVHKDFLIVRVGLERYEDALAQPGTRVFDITGRPMRGWVMVHPEGFEKEADLRSWVQRGVDFAVTLPAK